MAGTPRPHTGLDRFDQELIALWDDAERLRTRSPSQAYVALKRARYTLLEVLDAATEPPKEKKNDKR